MILFLWKGTFKLSLTIIFQALRRLEVAALGSDSIEVEALTCQKLGSFS